MDENDLELAVIARRGGQVQKLIVNRTVGLDDLKTYSGCEGLKETDGVFCRFSWPSVTPAEITFRFRTELSLMDDPYFVWTVQDFAFIDDVEIDYSGIRSAVGRVSAVPYIRIQAAILITTKSWEDFRFRSAALPVQETVLH